MPPTKTTWPTGWNMQNLLEHLGGISPSRIRMDPLPGLAREEDLLKIQAREDRHYELVDGVLVEKVMGSRESFLGGLICRLLGNYAEEKDLGDVTPGDGPYRLGEGIVRLPDVAFVPWSQLPGRMYPQDAIPSIVPTLVVEVLSDNNTQGEVDRKLREYFLAGVLCVWVVDPDLRAVYVYSDPETFKTVREGQALSGESILPGFSLPLARLFARVEKREPTPPPKRPRKKRS